MRGHEHLIAMRKSGTLPSKVAFVTDMQGPLQPKSAWERWESQGYAKSLIPDIEIDPNDTPARLDFRFLTGLTVCVQGHNSDRLDAIVAAIEQVKPERVIATLHDPKTAACSRISDTEGHLSWPA